MALDDGAEIDPATLPENIRLTGEMDAEIAAASMPAALESPATGGMRDLLLEALSATIEQLPMALADREAPHVLEEDLRTGLALNLGRSPALVFTEAKLTLPGWTPNLGGSDILVVGTDGAAVLIETKWESVWQSLWDILKLASGHQHTRISAAYAVYAAKGTEWATQACAQLFAPDQKSSFDTRWLLEEHERDWQRNLKGSPKVRVTEVPGAIGLETVFAGTVEWLGSRYEVRAISVTQFPAAPVKIAT
jgi:hypothetical protein